MVSTSKGAHGGHPEEGEGGMDVATRLLLDRLDLHTSDKLVSACVSVEGAWNERL